MWVTGGKARDDSQVSVLVTVVASPQRWGAYWRRPFGGPAKCEGMEREVGIRCWGGTPITQALVSHRQ